MKKYLAILLVLVMTLGLFAACDNSTPVDTTPPDTTPTETTAPVDTTPEPKDPITLVWHIRGSGEQKDNKKVFAEFNKQLQAIPGFEHITIDFRNTLSSDHAGTVERAYTAKEQIDIVCTVNLNPVNMSRDGYFVGLSQYFEKYPELWDLFPQWLWETQYVDNDYYVVPNYQRGSNPKVVYMRESDSKLCDWAGFCDLVTWKDGKSKGTLTQILDKIEEMYLALKAAGREVYIISPYTVLDGYNQVTNWREYLLDNTPTKGAWFADFQTGKVASLYMTEEFKTCWEYAAKWQEAGYFPDDIDINPNAYTWGSGLGWIKFDQTSAWEQDEASAAVNAAHAGNIGEPIVVLRTNDKPYMENRWAAGGNAVSTTCENPEDAVAFLALLNSEAGKELYNMLVYGLEDVHWEWTDKENELIYTFEWDDDGFMSSHAIDKWCIGNTFNAYDNQGCAVGEREVASWINANGVTSPYAGVKINTTEVETEVSNVSSIPSSYAAYYMYGVGGMAAFNEKYAEMTDLLVKAGVDTVTKDLQAQIDDYIASRA